MKKIVSILFCLFLISLRSFGGSSVGNGGDAIVCKNLDNQITSVELLDYYEARAEQGLQIDLSSADSTEKNVQKMIERIGHHEIYFQNLLTEWFNEFYTNSLFLENVDLVDVPDSNHLTIPKGCKVEQAAIQKVPTSNSKKFYTISKDLWDKMDSVSRAGLIMHELIYKSLTLYSTFDYDSTYVRQLNALAASNQVVSIQFSDYVKLLLKLSVPYVNIGNILVPTSSLEFSSDDKLIGYTLSAKKTVNQASILQVTPELFIHYNEFGGSVKVDFTDNDIVHVRPLIGQPQIIVYKGRTFKTTKIWPRFELNKVDKRLLKILSAVNHGHVTFEIPSIFHPKIAAGANCEVIEFSKIEDGFFGCHKPTLLTSLFDMNLPGSEFNHIQSLGNYAKVVVNFNNFLFSNITTPDFQINFDNGGRVERIQCSGQKESGYGDILLSPFAVKNPIAVGLEDLDYRQNRILCYENSPSKSEFSTGGAVLNSSSLNLFYSVVFGPSKAVKCPAFEGTLQQEMLDTPKYDVYPNGQVVRLTVAASTLPPFTFVDGRKFRAFAGDVLRLNPDGYVEEIERNFCREIAR